MDCNSVKHLLSQTLKPPVAKVFMGRTLKLHVIKRSYWKLNKSSKIFHSQIFLRCSERFWTVNKGKTELANKTYHLYALLTAAIQEW